MTAVDDVVPELLRAVGDEVVLPHFRSLGAHQIRHKTPGDLVTVADEEAEERIADGLVALLPGSTVVGEEAASADPSLLDQVGHGRVWVVDPIDGTGNYAKGAPPFAVMVALLESGEATAGWIYDPVTGRLCHARRGRGAYVDGRPVRARATGADPPLAMLAREALSSLNAGARAATAFAPAPNPRCAGELYPQLALGTTDVALFAGALPWDHAPGTLFVTEAGGRAAQPDGVPYRVTDRGPGLLVAATAELWERAAAVLVP